MREFGDSSIWEEKYRPINLDDIIITPVMRRFIEKVKGMKSSPNLLFSGIHGTGKTTLAKIIGRELNSTVKHMNCSIDTSINDIRDTVTRFATTNSLVDDNQKICIMDECDRLSSEAMDSLKGLIEEVHTNCRFIFITNSFQKIIGPLDSRTKHFEFGFEEKDKQYLIGEYYKRAVFVLETEDIEFDRKPLAEFIVDTYPDFRKTLGELQKHVLCYGSVGKELKNFRSNGDKMHELMVAIRALKFDDVRRLCPLVDSRDFIIMFDKVLMDQYFKNSAKPNVYDLLYEFNYRDSMVSNHDVALTGFCNELMLTSKTKWWKDGKV